MIKNIVKILIEKSIFSFFEKGEWQEFKIPEIFIERPCPPAGRPEEKSFGDYATALSLKLAGVLKTPPLDIAGKIVNEIKKFPEFEEYFEKIEIAPPGFINFFIKKDFLKKEIKSILKKGENFGKSKIGKNQKVLIEFISANPTGPLHIGHGRGAFFGDVLANLLKSIGFKVSKEYYINDAKNSGQIKELGRTVLGEGKTYLTTKLKTQISKLKTQIKKLKLKSPLNLEGEAGYLLAQEIQKENEKFIEKNIKIHFDNWFSENTLHPKKINNIFQSLKNKNLVYEKDGAWWLSTSEYGDSEDRVLVRSSRSIAGQAGEPSPTGEPTYFLSDIAYHKNKFSRGFKKIINIWGADHHGHVARLMAAKKIFDWQGDLNILISQIVSLKSKGKAVKMSKRKGEVVNLSWLVEKVGLDVVRFFYLTKSLGAQMEFDLNLALKTSKENPVFYIQYAYARISSIFKKAKNISFANFNPDLLKTESELNLIKKLIIYPEILSETSFDYELHHLTTYAMELASLFHNFYEKNRVISKDKKLTQARLALVASCRIVLDNLLGILGVSRPKRM